MTEETQVKCLLLPLHQRLLLVPNAVVAEVLSDQLLAPAPAGAPDWQMGQIGWRSERELKVISFEGVCGEMPSIPTEVANVVVMYSIDGTRKNRFYGLYITGTPKFQMIDANTLSLSSNQPGNANCIASRIVINGAEGYIPELDEIARLIA